jgi:CubicO group peptidase (beta-lactamase class C family)
VPTQGTTLPSDVEYGYQWWLVGRTSKHPWFAARGNGGQSLVVIPTLDLVVASMAGNYNSTGQGDVPMTVLNEIVLPALKGK